MFSMIRKRFTYANVAMTLALVFAMTGGAYAAKHYLITSTKQISPKVLTALKGKNGTNGTNGTNGAQGPVGEKGAQGSQGSAGPAGTGKEGPVGPAGPQGPTGQTGFTETLPSGKTETGVISYAAFSTGPAIVPFSINIPLPAEIAESKVHFVTQAEVTGGTAPPECEGGAAAPTAKPGSFCVYETSGGLFNASVGKIENPVTGTPGVSANGGYLLVSITAAPGWIKATWAVTAA
jgi:hypothetical protein